MEFKEAMRIWRRMCDANNCDKGCNECPMYDYCDAGVCRFSDEAEAILAKWAEEHPERTRIDDFLDKHPRAKRRDDGTPTSCAENCGYVDKCQPGKMSCADCWREPLEEAHHDTTV